MAPKVLVIEDNEDNRTLISRLLTYHGYEVLMACDGEDGIVKAVAEMPDIIIMDIQMPKLNGIAATQRIKADPATRHIKIIAVTSFAMPGDKDTIMAAGADAYMAKPIDTRELPELIKNLTG
jgi:two-component system, cell cycle response regulator DivK